MSHVAVTTGAPSSFIASSPASRWSGLRLAMTIDAPRRANSDAMALPRPVPAPVTNTQVPSNVPGLRAVSPGGGGWGRPGTSALSVCRRPFVGLRGPHLGEVLALVDERLVDQLVAHRRLLLRTGQADVDSGGHPHGVGRRTRLLV